MNICINSHCISLTALSFQSHMHTHTYTTASHSTREMLKKGTLGPPPSPCRSSSLNNTVSLLSEIFLLLFFFFFPKSKFCVPLSSSPVNEEPQEETHSYVDQLPVSEIIHQVRKSNSEVEPQKKCARRLLPSR